MALFKLSKTITMILLVLICNISNAKTIPLTKCSELKAPKTILVVYAEWCGHCQHFLPEYETISNKPEYADWKFYTKASNDFDAVCGMEIKGVPTIAKDNLKSVLFGEVSESALENFINN